MKYLSVCSGIEAATVAWHHMGWDPVGFSEIEPFPAALLQHYYPDVPNFGDMNAFREWPETDFDVLVGGTPCQSFSVAGLRKGMEDPRGNLALVYVAILARYSPRWFVWENVPGVLSSNEGRDFGSFIGAVVKLGYGVAWRVLDAQFFGVPQRRRRVFVVGCIGDWRRATQVLFEPESLRRNPAPRRRSRKEIAGTLRHGTFTGGSPTGKDGRASLMIPAVCPTLSESGGHARPGDNLQSVGTLIPQVANPLTARMHKGLNTTLDEGQTPIVTHALRGESFDASEDGTGRGTPIIPAFIATDYKTGQFEAVQVSGPLTTSADRSRSAPLVAAPLTAGSNPKSNAAGRRREDDENIVVESPPILYSIMPQNSGKCYTARECKVAQPLMAGGPVGGNQGGDVLVSGADVYNATLTGDVAATMTVGVGNEQMSGPKLVDRLAVRRLTPLECERLQGFPDGYTAIPVSKRNRIAETHEMIRYFHSTGQEGAIKNGGHMAADGPRYKALGNSMAVPVMRWIGERIAKYED